jgi:hypothetical protein
LTYSLILCIAEKILKFENCSALKYRFMCDVTTVIQRCGRRFKCCRKDFGNLHFLPQNGKKMVRTVDFAFPLNNFERFKKLKIGRFFVLFSNSGFYLLFNFFWMVRIKSLILPLESGTNIFSVLIRTLKISRKQMCEGLLVHPVLRLFRLLTSQLLCLQILLVLYQVRVRPVQAGRKPRVEQFVQVPVEVGVLVDAVQLELKARE